MKTCNYTGNYRRVLERKLGRKLNKNEEAHHINLCRRDARPENLKPFVLKDHKALHRGPKQKSKKCPVCGLKRYGSNYQHVRIEKSLAVRLRKVASFFHRRGIQTDTNLSKYIPDALLPWQGGARLISLWDMKEFLAQDLAAIHQNIMQIVTDSFRVRDLDELAKSGKKIRGRAGTAAKKRKIAEKISFIKKVTQSLGLRSTTQQAIRFERNLPKANSDEIYEDLKSLSYRYYDEIVDLTFLYLTSDKRQFYNRTTPLGELGQAHFPAANLEIIEASNCYAFERYTACVFHLVRACEVGVKALYKTLGIAAPKLGNSWGNLLKPMDDELKKPVKDRCDLWSKESEFFDSATNDVRAIKRAWRDSTMHVQSAYDESSALKVFLAVESFFRHLSRKINEEGNLI